MTPSLAQAVAKQPEQIEISVPLFSRIIPSARIESIRKELLETKYSVCLERPTLMEEF
ncbi:MAG: hypothetical protein PF482_10085 [Desulfobacteraceae bacterium]|jgi:hypothetical protein|nr:hypothetical protein [Desulfobacteraceae bacterium]